MSLSLKRNLLIDVKLNGGLFYCVMNCGKRPIVAKGGNSSKHLQSWEGKRGTKILFIYLRIYESKHELAFLKPPHCGCRVKRHKKH